MTIQISKEEQANNLIRNHVIVAVGAGFIPFTLIDIGAIMAVQMNMLRQMTEVYEEPFMENLGKAFVASVASGVLSGYFGKELLGAMISEIPVVGPVLGLTALPIFAGATTYGVGKVFIQQFESGNTFLDFQPEKVRSYFSEQFEKGKLVAQDFLCKRDLKPE